MLTDAAWEFCLNACGDFFQLLQYLQYL